MKPKLEENTANMKSVDDSGKYSGVLLKPCPISPLDAIEVSAFSSCIPLPFFHSNNLSIL